MYNKSFRRALDFSSGMSYRNVVFLFSVSCWYRWFKGRVLEFCMAKVTTNLKSVFNGLSDVKAINFISCILRNHKEKDSNKNAQRVRIVIYVSYFLSSELREYLQFH